jgi:PQQ enzyme repeat
MKPLFSISLLAVAGLWSAPTYAQVNVTQEHNNLSRDGLYIDSAFTPSAAANVTRDLGFDGTISGNVYAQPLYIGNGPGGAAMVIVVTESNNVYALDALTGTVIWQRNVGAPVTSGLPCGNISPLGITGTPVVDLASRSLFFDAMIDGPTKKHFIYSLNVDTGAINPGWPVDVDAAATHNGITFTSSIQNQRAALGLVNGVVYVPYSGHFGDCGTFRGWVVGVPINNPDSVTAWATPAIGGGIWGHGGVASDGTHIFVITGNTFNTGGNWGGGEAFIRLQAGPVFSGSPTDYWAPTNWLALDNGDTDLGGCGAVLINVPGAMPSQLGLALGKDGNAYLLRRNNLGGITTPVASANVANFIAGQAAAAYRTSQGTYFVFRNGSSSVSAYRITPTNPPAIVPAWSVSQNGRGSPWVTTTNGTNNAIVWVVGAGGDQRLHGYNGDTGAVIYAGGGPNELMANTRKWNTGIVARGRIYFAADNKVYAFAVTAGTPTPTPPPTATPTPTPTPCQAPIAPSGLTCTPISPTEIDLMWTDNSSSETGFKIARSTDGVHFTQIAIVGADVRTYPSTLLTPETTYYYRVRSYLRCNNQHYNSGFSNVASCTTFAAPTPTPTPTPTPSPSPTPAPPSNLSATPGTCLKIDLSWTDNSMDESGFKIERSQDNVRFNQIDTVAADTTSYTAQQGSSGRRYFRVRAYNAAGNSPYSNTASATSDPCPTPTSTPALSGLTYNGGTPFVDGTSLIRGTSCTVTAQANTNTQSVVFNKDGVVVKRDSTTPFDFTWTPMAIGPHTFAATPWSSIGGTGTSGRSITRNYRVVAASPTPTPTASPTPTATP